MMYQDEIQRVFGKGYSLIDDIDPIQNTKQFSLLPDEYIDDVAQFSIAGNIPSAIIASVSTMLSGFGFALGGAAVASIVKAFMNVTKEVGKGNKLKSLKDPKIRESIRTAAKGMLKHLPIGKIAIGAAVIAITVGVLKLLGVFDKSVKEDEAKEVVQEVLAEDPELAQVMDDDQGSVAQFSDGDEINLEKDDPVDDEEPVPPSAVPASVKTGVKAALAGFGISTSAAMLISLGTVVFKHAKKFGFKNSFKEAMNKKNFIPAVSKLAKAVWKFIKINKVKIGIGVGAATIVVGVTAAILKYTGVFDKSVTKQQAEQVVRDAINDDVQLASEIENSDGR